MLAYEKDAGSGADFTNTEFNNAYTDYLTSGGNPFTGQFHPDQPMCPGQAANGTWQLKVTDMSGGDVGTIDSWSLELCVCESAALPIYVPMIIQQPVTGVTTLKSKKTPWAHLSKTLNRPGWLGGNAKIGSTGS
jgi:hypothetical protein